ncbi:hypothetical protein [Streptomyces sp. NBC_00690]|uniref:hypothetical protein n=1 Tax=Streptomyces sp. NBC_00690 TaxID=2975808 RepID=UPI002E2969BA|nr:hypothetical protein [Streptomyces sp. NBC_00690]
MTAPHPTARTLAERIATLYGQPLAALEAHADSAPHDSMLTALLGSLADLQLAERSIAFHRDRMLQLAHPERSIEAFDAGHLLDNARRIGEAVAVRDAHAKTLSAVLQSLHRIPTPPAPEPAPAPLAAPAPAAARTR